MDTVQGEEPWEITSQLFVWDQLKYLAGLGLRANGEYAVAYFRFVSKCEGDLRG